MLVKIANVWVDCEAVTSVCLYGIYTQVRFKGGEGPMNVLTQDATVDEAANIINQARMETRRKLYRQETPRPVRRIRETDGN